MPTREQLDKDIQDVLLRMKRLEQDYADLRTKDVLTKISGIEKKYIDLDKKCQQLVHFESMNSSFGDPGPSDVYFTAMTSKNIRGLVKGENVVYDNDFVNVGGGYDTNTGIFTAPTAGVYLFSANCNSLTAQSVNTEMIRDGSIKGNCYVEPAFDGEDEIGSVTYVDRLNIGDEVWMEIRYPDKGTVELGAHLNTFLGVLIHR